MSYGLGQLQGLNGGVSADQWIRWQGKIYLGGTESIVALTNNVQQQIEGALWSQGWFSQLQVYHAPLNPLNVIINAKPSQGFGDLDDARRVIEGAIYEYTADPVTGSPYYASTEQIGIEGYVGPDDSGSVPVTPSGVPAIPPSGNPNITDAKTQCTAKGGYYSPVCGCGYAWSWLPPGCAKADAQGNTPSLAEQLGIDQTKAAAFGGVTGILVAFVVVIAISKIAR